MIFRVVCTEDVESVYLVEAESEGQARERLREDGAGAGMGTDWEHVTQEDYMAFSRAWRSCTQVENVLDSPHG